MSARFSIRKFKLVDTNRYIMPCYILEEVPGGPPPGVYPRFIHQATVQYGNRSFTFMLDRWESRMFLNEKMGLDHYEGIGDDEDDLFRDIMDFLQEKNIGKIIKGQPDTENPLNVNSDGPFQGGRSKEFPV